MHRNQQRSRWWSKALVFTGAAALGGVSAGALMGIVGGTVGPEVRALAGSLFGLGALGLGALALIGRSLPLPQCDRETSQRWVHGGPLRWAACNGLALGCGATSRIGFWAWYAVPVGAFLSGDAALGALLYGSYGLARGAGAWLLIAAAAIARRRGSTFDDLAVWLLGRAPAARTISGALLLFLGGLATLAVGS